MLRQLINQLAKILAPLAPPVFPDDEDKTRKAKYANFIALVFLFFTVGFELWARIFAHYVRITFMDGMIVAIAAACILGLVRLREGHVRFTSIMLVVIVWVACNGMAAGSFGVKDITYIINFAIILMAGLLLGWPGAWTFTGLSILS